MQKERDMRATERRLTTRNPSRNPGAGFDSRCGHSGLCIWYLFLLDVFALDCVCQLPVVSLHQQHYASS
jgi:hypothetical protein